MEVFSSEETTKSRLPSCFPCHTHARRGRAPWRPAGALAAFGTHLASTDSVAILAIVPTPELRRGRSRSKIASALRKGGRQRNLERRAGEIQSALQTDQLEAPTLIADAHGLIVRSAMVLITTFNAQIAELEAALSEHGAGVDLCQHPPINRQSRHLGGILAAAPSQWRIRSSAPQHTP